MTGLNRQVMFYIAFQVVVFATLAVEMAMVISGVEVHGALVEIGKEHGVAAALLLEPIRIVAVKVALLMGILLLSTTIVMTLLVKRITIPLTRITEASARIARGDLSATAPVHFKDELGRLASSVNDLSANYQELLLLMLDASQRAKTQTEHTRRDLLRQNVVVPPDLDELEGALDEISSTLKEFGRCYYRTGDGT